MADYAIVHNLDIKRNDTYKHTIGNVLDRSGSPMQWAGCEARMQIRDSRGSAPLIDVQTPTEIDLSVDGQISFNIDESKMDIDEGNYLYDFELRKNNDVITPIKGQAFVYDDITYD